MDLPLLYLKRDDDRRLLAGHRWIFSNEVARVDVSTSGAANDDAASGATTAGDAGAGAAGPAAAELPLGSLVLVRSHRGDLLGAAHYNRHALIAGRLLADAPEAAALAAGKLTEETLLRAAIERAVARRRAMPGLHPEAHRLVFGESDGLPGLVADRYGAVVCVQILTAGMARHRALLADAFAALPGIAAVWEKTSSPYLEMEGLEPVNDWLRGEVPLPFVIAASGPHAAMEIDFRASQKTGTFLDQLANRRWLREALRAQLARPAVGGAAGEAYNDSAPVPAADTDAATRPLRVLDVFCYHAGWGIAAALAAREAGAPAQVVVVDGSADALAAAGRDAELNGVDDDLASIESDAFKALEGLRAEPPFDVVIVDPPAFAKSRKDVGRAIKAYERLNTLAAQVTAPGGLLVSCSCSHHIESDAFDTLLVRALRRAGRSAQIAHRGDQAPDHPVLLGMRETSYLKMVAMRMLP